MKVKFLIVWLLLITFNLFSKDKDVRRFEASEGGPDAGFFWVDTMTADTWKLNASKMKWIYVGKPKKASKSKIRTYIPKINKSGTGVFILNRYTGATWWTDGLVWKSVGIPKVSHRNDKK